MHTGDKIISYQGQHGSYLAKTWFDMQTLSRWIFPPLSNIARNGNQSSKWAYFSERRSFMTGLNGAFLITFFRICGCWAQNRE
jgi:hypothetical protein